MFKVIESIDEADRLWEAGLLWCKWNTDCEWLPDGRAYALHKPSIFGFTDIADGVYLQYAILLED